MENQNGDLTCWLLDTRTLWPGSRIEDAVSESSLVPSFFFLIVPGRRCVAHDLER